MDINNISIILPVYNEEEVIKKFYNSLLDQIKKIDGYKFRILFVVDKSKDNTEVIIRHLIMKYCNNYYDIMGLCVVLFMILCDYVV